MTSLSSPSMPMRVRKPDSPSPDGTRACSLGLVQWSASLIRMGALPKECNMGAENPLLNFRCPVEVKDLLTLHARREGAEVGPMLRQWMGERLATERVLSLIKSVGLLEVMRRMSGGRA